MFNWSIILYYTQKINTITFSAPNKLSLPLPYTITLLETYCALVKLQRNPRKNLSITFEG